MFTLSPTAVADSDPDGLDVTNPTIDAGLVPVLSLGDLVWVDDDRDGVYDVGTERPLAGVTVRLTDAAGNPVDDAAGDPVGPVQTDVDGRYFFTNLNPGTYRVEFDLPAGTIWTAADQGGADSLDSDATFATTTDATAVTAPFALTPTPATDNDPDGLDLTNPTIDAGVVPLLSLGDLVWVDENRDGVYDPVTELPLAGVVVALLDAAGNPATDAFGVAQTATTGPDGRWSFDNLLPGDYRVSFTQPGGFVWTQPNLGADDSLDSDAVGATPGAPTATTGVFTLSSTPVGDNDPDGLDVTNPTIDAGLVPLVSVGDLAWIDLDRDGQFDLGVEAGIAGVTVVLQTAVGGPVTDGLGQVVPAATTDADGRYSFDDLLPGTYQVRFTLPTGYAWTSSNTAASDGLDSDPIPVNPGSPTATTAPFVLTSTPVVDDDTSAAALDVTDPTVDAGVVPRLSVGDLVWVDADADGVQDPTELPLAGVTVTLVDRNGAPVTDVLGNPVGPTTTDADGRYSFTNLAPGDYRVVFTLPPGFSWTPDGSGPDRSLDSNADAVTPFAPTASTPVFTLSPTAVADSDPDGLDVTNPTIDAGLVPVLSLGDLVWVDDDRDGVYDVGTERPLAGVTVRLTDAAGNPVDDAAGDPVGPVQTDVDGRYFFTNLNPGTYRVEFDLPAGTIWTAADQGGADSLDSDATFATTTDATAVTAPFALTPTPATDNDPDGLSVTNPTLDAGVVPRLSLGDAVWIDADDDGVYDPTESGMAGVTVTLLDANGNPVTDVFGNPVAAVTTGPDGRYQFSDLPPGDYQVVFTLPAGYGWARPNAGADDGLDSDVAPVTRTSPTGSTGVFTLSSVPVTDTDPSANRRPVTNPTLDAGVVPLLSAGDRVWSDTDGDGVQDPGEPPLAGVTVTLLDGNGNPASRRERQPDPAGHHRRRRPLPVRRPAARRLPDRVHPRAGLRLDGPERWGRRQPRQRHRARRADRSDGPDRRVHAHADARHRQRSERQPPPGHQPDARRRDEAGAVGRRPRVVRHRRRRRARPGRAAGAGGHRHAAHR